MSVDIEHINHWSEILGSWVSEAIIHVSDIDGDYVSEAILDFDRELGWEIYSLDVLNFDFDSDVPKEIVCLYVEAIEKFLDDEGVNQRLDINIWTKS